MTTRHKGYVIVLEKDIREDDAEALMLAMRMLKGVADVRPVENEPDDQINRYRVKEGLRDSLMQWVRENL